MVDTWYMDSYGSGIHKVSNFDFECQNPGETVINMVFGNSKDLFTSRGKKKEYVFKFEKQIVITVGSK
jgi:predicted HTH transcriptional regulator